MQTLAICRMKGGPLDGGTLKVQHARRVVTVDRLCLNLPGKHVYERIGTTDEFRYLGVGKS